MIIDHTLKNLTWDAEHLNLIFQLFEFLVDHVYNILIRLSYILFVAIMLIFRQIYFILEDELL